MIRLTRSRFLAVVAALTVWGGGVPSRAQPLADPCEASLGQVLESAYARERARVEWKDSATEKLHQMLDEPLPNGLKAELEPRWVKVEEAAQKLGWQPGVSRLSPHFQRLRNELSTTISGTNPIEVDTADQAERNWHRADALRREWVRTGAPITKKRMLELNATLGEGLTFNGNEPGRLRRGIVGVPHENGFQAAHSAKDVAQAMDLFELWYHEAEARMAPIELAAAVYQRLNTIHPFPDANGRTTRLVMDWVLERQGLPPALFANKDQTNVVLFPDDVLGKNPPPGKPLRDLTDAMERSVRVLQSERQGLPKLVPRSQLSR